MARFVGIDLGTTYSAVACYENGVARILENADGDNTTPSCILFEDNENVVIGTEAKNNSIINPEDYQAFVKRSIGEKKKLYKDYTPESLSALILKKLKSDAEKALGEKIDGAVITVPAYFTDAERTATKQAAAMADLPVLEIINEPTAAALAYSMNHKNDSEQVVLVYDLGGGTFDVSLVKYQNEKFDVLVNRGNHYLGGYDFDNAIVELVKEKLEEKSVDIDDDIDAKQQLQIQAEIAKKSLSQRRQTNINIYVGGKPYKIEITREEFEDEIEPKIINTLATMDLVMEDAEKLYGITYEKVDKILLVGGSTRIPLISSMIEEETKIKPSNDIHPDEAVALGAAYYSSNFTEVPKEVSESAVENNHQPLNQKNTATATATSTVATTSAPANKWFTDCTAHSIGVVIHDVETDTLVNSIILPRNTPVPAKHTDVFETIIDYQEKLEVQITQGEETDLRYVKIVGTSTLMLRPKPRGAQIAVTISCDEGALIHVNVFDVDDNISLGEMSVVRESNLNEEEVKKQTSIVKKLSIGDCDD